MNHIAGYQNHAMIHEGAATVVSRAVRETDGLRVVIKAQNPRFPVPVEVARFRRERDILSRIESEHVVSCLGLAEQDDRLSLILEDFGGESLDKLIESRPLTNFEALEIALQAVKALGDIHAAGVVHGNINPSNLVWNSETEQLKIIDFSNATAPWLPLPLPLTADERQLRGTLAYMSPEQTGRLNRGVDHRSDFYSLGATLYALLVNTPPFSSPDTLEMVHAHIARTPTPLHERDPSIPAAISEIVMKLLSKAPEQRYQSARGIQADIRHCLNQLRAGLDIAEEFVPGRHDIPEIFGVSGKLYGRNEERRILTEALYRATRGLAEFALVSGPSGIGKSSLAFELAHQTTARGGYFIAGKFDQITSGAPYSAVAAAFLQLAADLLSATKQARDRYRAKLLSTLGANTRIIVDLIPQLELIVGAQPPVPALPADATRNRFHLVFKQFIGAVASYDHPLVLFLDDLQWADRSSLSLVAELVTDTASQYFFVVGAYRTSEVGADHPLIQTISRMRDEGAAMVEVKLSPLNRGDVGELLGDSFQASRNKVAPLADAIIDKTDGNPFLMHRLLTQLHDKEFLQFDDNKSRWHWDIKAIRAYGSENTTADLIEATLRELPAPTQKLLSKAACLGLRFDLDKLSLIVEENRSGVLRTLTPAIRGHLLSAVATTLPPNEAGETFVETRFGFIHDQVQRAAYELIPGKSRSAVHLDIGRKLLARRPIDELGEQDFEVLEHLNRGCTLIEDRKERLELIRLNLKAGLSAKVASAYGAARQYFEVARELLKEDGWVKNCALTRQVYMGCAETEFLVGDVLRARDLIKKALEHTDNPVERAELHDLLIVQQTLQGKYDEAVEVGRESLAALGVPLPSSDFESALDQELNRVRDLDPEKQAKQMAPVMKMNEPKIQAAMRLLMNLLPPTDFTNATLNSWVAVKMVNLSLEFGYAPESAKGFANLGNVLALKGQYKRGAAFGSLALSVLEHFESTALKPRVLYTLATYLNHWIHPLQESRRIGDEAFRACLDVGELQYAGYVLGFHKTMNEIFLGENLESVRRKLDEYLRFTTKTKNNLARSVVVAAYNVVLNLQGQSPGYASFDSDLISEKEMLADCETRGTSMAVCLFHLLQAHAFFLHGDYRQALAKISEAEKRIEYVSTTMSVAILPFIDAMTLSAMHSGVRELEAIGCWDRLLAHREAIAHWEQLCPNNFKAPSLLVQAEIARLEGRHIEAMRLYDSAIESATDTGFIPIDALANERAGRFWLTLEKPDFAKNYLERAHASYARWGARRKVERLAQEFPDLAPDRLASDDRAAGTDSRRWPQNLDLEAVIRMSQAIASELRLERLLATLVKLLIEAAGAQRALLFRAESDGLKLEAIGDVDSETPLVLESIAVDDAKGFPKSVVNFVAQTNRELVLDDALSDEHYRNDPYVREKGLKSVLCLPFIQQQRLAGIVYLENRLATGVFTADRVGLVRVLAAEAAIAINNALLFGSVERKVEERTAELAKATRLAERARLTAEDANRAKSDFLANMSHELRTPLNAILGYTELMLDQIYGELPEKTREVLQRVEHNGRHLLSLINDVLDLSKIEAGRFSMPLVEYSMSDVVGNVIGSVESLAAEKNLAIKVSLPTVLPLGTGNEQRITQVLLNLVGNAIKFTDNGEVEVKVTVSDDSFVVSVSDSGIGISEADQAKIFEKFHRVDTAVTRGNGGTGLGLAIAKRMIEMQGGRMWVQSTPGKGSTFSFSLPVVVEVQPETI